MTKDTWKNISFIIGMILVGIIFLSVFLSSFTEDAFASNDKVIRSKDDLNNSDILLGVGQGGAAEQIAEKELPNARLMYYSNTDGYQAVIQGKVDAFVFDRKQMEYAMENGVTGVRLLDEDLDEKVHVAVGISLVSDIENIEGQLNTFIGELKKDGTLDEMYERWVIQNDETFPDIELPTDPKYHITVGTTGIVAPFSYYKDSKLNGYDIELAYRFAAWLDAGLDFKVYDYSGIISAAASGDVDCIMADLNVTPERAERLHFTDDLFVESIGIMVKDENAPVPEYKVFEDLSGKRVSMLTGAPFEELVKSKAPNVAEFTFYNTMSDMLLALKTDKTDAVLTNNALAQLAVNRNSDLAKFPEDLNDGVFGFAFAKGNAERDKWQKAFDSIPESEILEIWSKWTGSDDSKKILPEQDWPGNNGTVTVAACDTVEPMSYIGQDGQLVGFDIELILLMARELDVHVDFLELEFSSVLPYIESGKALLGNGSIIVTDERKESVDFIEYFPASFVLVVRAEEKDNEVIDFFDSIKDGFEKNFIRESRWKLFRVGILVTLLITVLSIIFGTLLGFIVFLLCKEGNPVANTVTRFSVWLLHGMPMVVLLMIMYYIIFRNLNISGMIVSVIAFSLTFGSSVYSLLKMGVGAVDKGQYEAAYALGYSVNQTFFRIILPQALPHVMGSYKGQIVSLLKATAIVGYIAVQDLTKVGDIVRSRTYDAFFPLIAIAVIYFILEGLFGLIVDRIHLHMDPKRRQPEDILKGVDVHDKD